MKGRHEGDVGKKTKAGKREMWMGEHNRGGEEGETDAEVLLYITMFYLGQLGRSP